MGFKTTPPAPQSVAGSTPAAAPAGAESLAAQAPVALAPTAASVTSSTPVSAPSGGNSLVALAPTAAPAGAMVIGGPVSPPPEPDVPDEVVISQVTTTDLYVTTPSLVNGETEQTLEQSLDGEAWDFVEALTGNETILVFGLAPATEYFFRVVCGGVEGPAVSATTNAVGTMTLVSREPFINIGELTAGAPGGNFNAVTGTLYKRLHGPRVAGQAKGWSVDNRPVGSSGQTIAGRFLTPGADGVSGGPTWTRCLISGWYYIRKGTFAINNATQLLSISRFGGANQVGMTIEALNGILRAKHGTTTSDLDANSFPFEDRWVWFGIAARWISGSSYDSRFYYKVPGGPLQTWASFTATGGSYGSADMDFAWFGMVAFSSNHPQFRLGCPSVHTFAQNDFTDVTHPPDVAEPSDAGQTWYVNPSTGSDSNDGGSAAQAWQTVTKINEESLRVGLFTKATAGYASGDTLIIDTSAAPLDLAGTVLDLRTNSLNVQPAAGATEIEVKMHKVMTNAAFTNTSGAIYETADTQADVVIWEDGKWLDHKSGANFAAVQAALQATPGSFYTDGTKMYVHPLGSTNPTTDGKVYTRSRLYAAGISAIGLHMANYRVNGFRGGKTCLSRSTDKDAIGAYGIGDSNAPTYPGQVNRVENCYLDYCSKHAFGFTVGLDDSHLTVINCQAEQCSPYGSQTCWVSFMGGIHTGNVHRYENCTTNKQIGLIGSTAGADTNTEAFYSHNTGEANQFERIELVNCLFPNAGIGGGAVDVVQATGCACSTIGYANIEVLRCTITGHVSFSAGWVRHSKLAPTGSLSGTNVGDLSGTVEVSHCLIDLSGVSGALADRGGIWERIAALNFSFFNNIFIGKAGSECKVAHDMVVGDTINWHHNRYHNLGPAASIAHYDSASRTLAQMEALTFEANSTVGDPGVNGSGIPQPGSPCLDAGQDTGPAVDFTGATFAVRNDIGAYERI